jgi:L-asparaginase/Glu-tRNA(Gln) amidotransferase subunit D
MLFNTISNGQSLEVARLRPRTILCLEGGGTIASVPSRVGKVPRLSLREIFERALPNYATLANLVFPESGPVLGELVASPNIVPSHYVKFADAIFQALMDERIESVFLSLGTDTLAFVAAALSEIFPTPNKAVVLTGAQRSLEHANTDISNNLRTALLAVRFLPPSIYVVFGGVVIEGAVVSKLSSRRDGGFGLLTQNRLQFSKEKLHLFKLV